MHRADPAACRRCAGSRIAKSSTNRNDCPRCSRSSSKRPRRRAPPIRELGTVPKDVYLAAETTAQKAAVATHRLGNAQREVAAANEKYRKELEGNREALTYEITNLKITGKNVEDLATQYRISTETVARFRDELQASGKAAARAGSDLKKLEGDLQELDARIAERSTNMSAADLAKRFGADTQARIQEALDLGRSIDTLPPRILAVAETWRQANFETAKADWLKTANDQARALVDTLIEEQQRIVDKQREAGNARFLGENEEQLTAIRENLRLQEEADTDSLERRLGAVQHHYALQRIELRGRVGDHTETLAIIDENERLAASHATDAWEQHLTDVRAQANSYPNIFKTALAGIPNLIQQALTGGGGFKGAGQSILSGLGSQLGGKLFGNLAAKASNTLFKTFGSTITSALGVALPGIGSAVGALAGPLIGKLGSKLFGKAGRQKVNEFAESMGGYDALHTKLADLPDGEKLWVQLTQKTGKNNAKQAEAHIKAVTDALEKHEQHTKAAREELTRLTQEGGLAGRALVAFRDRTKESAETLAFITSETQTAGKSFSSFLQAGATAYTKLADLRKKFQSASGSERDTLAADIKTQEQLLATVGVTTQASATGLGAALAGVFGELQAQGMSAREALTQIEPGVAALRTQLEATGLSGGAAFDHLAHLAGIAAGEISGPALDAIGHLSRGLQGVHNAGFLTQEMFGGLVGQIVQSRQAILDQGAAAEDVNALMQRDLQTIWQLKQDFNYEIDEATAKLLAEAHAAGVVGDQHRSAADRTAQALERVATSLEILTGRADRFGEALDTATRPRTVHVDYDVDAPPDLDPSYQPNPDPPGEGPSYAATGGRVDRDGITPAQYLRPRRHRPAIRRRADGVPAQGHRQRAGDAHARRDHFEYRPAAERRGRPDRRSDDHADRAARGAGGGARERRDHDRGRLRRRIERRHRHARHAGAPAQGQVQRARRPHAVARGARTDGGNDMRFCPPSALRGAAATVTSGGAVDAQYPLTNLHSGNPIDPVRWTTTAETRLVWDHGSPVTMEALMIVMHTFAAGATLQVEANSTNSWGAPAFSHAVVVPAWPDHLPANIVGDLRGTTLATTGYRYTSLLMPAQAVPHAIGELLWISAWTAVDGGQVGRNLQRADVRRIHVNSTAYGVEHVVERRVRQRRLWPSLEILSDSTRATVLALARDAGADRGWPVVIDVHATPFHASAEALFVRFHHESNRPARRTAADRRGP